MKNLIYILTAFLLVGGTSVATASSIESSTYNRTFRGYGNSFIFVEQGIEFAIFPDGQFDFNLDRYATNFGVSANVGGANISFNTGFVYDAYIQYDDFGAVIQIENVPIYYDHFGRIIQAGSVQINYNNRGFIRNVGGLFVHYNRWNRFSHCTGFINVWNRSYVFRPWHTYYVIPRAQFCILYNRPYRQFYTPIRHTWYRPYRDNIRPRVSYNAGRRNSRVATNNTLRRSDRYRQSNTGRRGDLAQARPSSSISRDGVQRGGASRGDNVRRDGVQRGKPAVSKRGDRVTKRDGVQRGRPVATSSRGDKVKPRGTVERGRPVANTRTDRKKERVQTTRPQQNRSKRVSTQSKRRTNSVAQRSTQSSQKRVASNSRSSSRSKANVKRGSSSKRSTATRSSRTKRGRQ